MHFPLANKAIRKLRDMYYGNFLACSFEPKKHDHIFDQRFPNILINTE